MEHKNVKLVTISLSPELLEQLDQKRDDLPRSRYIVRLIKRDLKKN